MYTSVLYQQTHTDKLGFIKYWYSTMFPVAHIFSSLTGFISTEYNNKQHKHTQFYLFQQQRIFYLF